MIARMASALALPPPWRRTLAGCALLGGVLLAAAGAVGAAGPADGAPPAHHVDGGYTNRDPDVQPPSPADWLRWRWQAARAGLPRAPRKPTPVAMPEVDFLAANARSGAAMEPTVTWIGHATVLLQMGGLNVLTDPVFSDSVGLLPVFRTTRAQPPALVPGRLPRIDLVLVSHDHHDHLDPPSLRALAAQPGGPPAAVVPLGLKARLLDAGFTGVVELDWWQSHQVGSVEVVLTPAQHWSGRHLAGRMATLWGAFALFGPDVHVYFLGGSGYSTDFVATRERFAARQRDGGFDLALLPIGGYEPRWYHAPRELSPADAVQVHQDLRARRSLGVRWGTFELGDEALDEPPLALAQARRQAGVGDNDFFLMAIGQTKRLPRRGAPQ
jgi:N-acyl-phosphatidylethanolamine-hydrolysing phospholipase D